MRSGSVSLEDGERKRRLSWMMEWRIMGGLKDVR